jgi:hypothetical protein
VLVNAAFYTGYAYTREHPRFLYVSLPAMFVLWAAGADKLCSAVWAARPTARRRAAPEP